MSEWEDRPKSVRSGEELDGDRLAAYLQTELPDLSGSLEIEQFPSGFSNLTYMVRLGETELVLRRPPFGANIKSAHDMGREYTILSHLHPVFGRVPRPLLYCTDETVIGAPFYVMERVRGVILRAKAKPDMQPTPLLMAQIADSLAQTLVDLHYVDMDAVGLTGFGKPDGYVQRQIEGWARRYLRAKTDNVPSIERAARWLHDNMPSEQGAALIHNDFKYDNVVLDSAEWQHIIAVLDWEMATIGDPMMDLGTSLGYWVEADDPPVMKMLALSPTTLPGNPTRAEFVDMYARKSGRAVPNIVFYYVYGLFKVAVIVQQIYKRYVQGHTQDPRFAGLLHAVQACGQMAELAIDKRRIDRLFA
ncbi:MAG: phosphotransferase family protein [Anaerolineae bacterium]|nr:phosphotransferase family protein [Anaerolineae bacterium]